MHINKFSLVAGQHLLFLSEYLKSYAIKTNLHIFGPVAFIGQTEKNGGSDGGRVVKVLACGARGPGFDSRPRHLNFQRLVISSCF